MTLEWLAAFLLLSGSTFVLIAAIGVLRFPDTLTRMHAATKAGAFGTTLMLLAAALVFRSPHVLIKLAMIVFFFYTTAPVAAHLLGRVAYLRTRIQKRMRVDEWGAQP